MLLLLVKDDIKINYVNAFFLLPVSQKGIKKTSGFEAVIHACR